jgi:pimeloyl-ACP methyl ester carboxylesterase
VGTVTSRDGTTIGFERVGEGPALIVVGGALSTGAAAAALATLLAPHHEVITYDRRGRGASTDTKPYAVAREIEDLGALVTEVGGSALVLGHSSGAALALEAAADGVGVERLALYEPPFIVDDTRPGLPADYVQHLDELIANDRPGDAVEYFMTVGVGVPAAVATQMRLDPSWTYLEAVAHTIPYDARIVDEHMGGKPLPTDRWTSATMPTLVMDGGDSDPWIRHSARELADVLPNARLQTLDGQTHQVAPDVLAPALEAFFLD